MLQIEKNIDQCIVAIILRLFSILYPFLKPILVIDAPWWKIFLLRSASFFLLAQFIAKYFPLKVDRDLMAKLIGSLLLVV